MESGRRVEVFAAETRPYLQGARLTAWELMADQIPVTLITDGMVGSLLARGGVGAVLVGADRIAANGDIANKIGTYQAAVLAKEHGVPFLVAAPFSSVDLKTPTGADIPIEERRPEEVAEIAGRRVAPEGVLVWNPAFDVTPARYITAIVTERGYRPPAVRCVLDPSCGAHSNPEESVSADALSMEPRRSGGRRSRHVLERSVLRHLVHHIVACFPTTTRDQNADYGGLTCARTFTCSRLRGPRIIGRMNTRQE